MSWSWRAGSRRGGYEKAWDGVLEAVICTGRVSFTIGCTTTLKYVINNHCNIFTCAAKFCPYTTSSGYLCG